MKEAKNIGVLEFEKKGMRQGQEKSCLKIIEDANKVQASKISGAKTKNATFSLVQ